MVSGVEPLKNMFKCLLSLFLLGLSFGIGPCLASCGPLLISYIAGTKKNILTGVFSYILFSLSRILSYTVLSLIIFWLRQVAVSYNLDFLNRYFLILGGLFIIFIGFLMVFGKNIESGICRNLQKFFLGNDKKTVLIFGFIIGFLPCAPLISLFTFMGLISKHWLDNLYYSVSFGLGTAVSPLFILVMLAGLIPKIIEHKIRLYRIFNIICGLIVICLGIRLIWRAI
jgi:sulfite exporter TauE/SafE